MFDSSKFTEAVIEKRGERSRRAAAEEAGIPSSTFDRIENGYGDPTVETLGRVCAWLGRPADDFFEHAPQPAAA